MQEFPSAKPSLGVFFGSIAPRLQPRFYSISSSSAKHPGSIHVTCAVVREVMPTGRVHEGVCSYWLKRAAVGTQVPIFVRRSSFKLPEDPQAAVLMVGPGTGLAPFRGFIQEREQLQLDHQELGPTVLYFGCRNRAHDFIYEAELRAAEEAGVLTELQVAFSREGPAKDYVQHHLERNADKVYTLLKKRNTHLYLCGDAKHMAKDVHRAIVALVQQCGEMSGTQAEAFVKELSDTGRYLKDVW